LIDRLLEAMAPLMLAKFDAETRRIVGAARGASRDERELELLQKARTESRCAGKIQRQNRP
jgi:hypothetical protein